ncbi:hypothetical protein M5K25_006726 [Dendrobium thyrsiflorum]|uniref:Reverse transcriptase n=1 Tax=Dendrobium thyrsiflorum TaxID=117978 RepID=A0ABD0VJD1_DENTH
MQITLEEDELDNTEFGKDSKENVEHDHSFRDGGLPQEDGRQLILEEGELNNARLDMGNIDGGHNHEDGELPQEVRQAGLRILCWIHNISFLVLLEPFINSINLVGTARFLGFKHAVANTSNKIWVFGKDPIVMDVIGYFTQVLHCNIKFLNLNYCASFVYAASSRSGRKFLWEQLTDFHSIYNLPWLVGGDFNSISNPSERIGGSTPVYHSMEDFNNMIMDCNLIDIGLSGNNFTWNRGKLWQHLDHVFWINLFNSIHVEHLSKTLFDHLPILITLKPRQVGSLPQFRFQNMWLLDDSFLNMVHENLGAPLHPDNSIANMNRFWLKLKRLKYKINWWNKNVFKNVFTNILNAEDKVNTIELNCQLYPSEDNFKLLRDAKDSLFKL